MLTISNDSFLGNVKILATKIGLNIALDMCILMIIADEIVNWVEITSNYFDIKDKLSLRISPLFSETKPKQHLFSLRHEPSSETLINYCDGFMAGKRSLACLRLSFLPFHSFLK